MPQSLGDDTPFGEPQPPSAPVSSSRKFPGADYVVVLLVILLFASIRYRLRDLPLERDEGEYAYAGQLILQGVPPYQLAYNMKLPGTYVAYAAMIALFGESPAGLHIGLIFVNAISIVLVFLITRKLFDPLAANVAAAAFGLFTIRPQLFGLAGHATHFVVLAALASILLLLKSRETHRTGLLFAAGLCAGIAFLMKQPGIFFVLFGIVYIASLHRRSSSAKPPLLRGLFAFSAGSILPYAFTCLLLAWAGVFANFWFWTFSYARAYGSEVSFRQALHYFAARMSFLTKDAVLIWVFIVLGMAAFLWEVRLKQHAPFVLALLACSFLAVSAGFYYRAHYFILIYPALTILAGVGVSAAASLVRRASSAKLAAALPVLLFAVAFAGPLFAERRLYFQESADAACREIYGDVPFPQALGIGKFIEQHSDPRSRIAVLGSEPEIYFYAKRLSATGYLYTYPLMEDQPFAEAMQQQFIREVESQKPEIIVSVMILESWGRRPDSKDLVLRWADSYLRANYSFIGIADGGNHDIYRWGPAAASYRPRRAAVLLVFRRNP